MNIPNNLKISIPDDLRFDIALNLDYKDIKLHFPELLQSDHFWKQLLLRDFQMVSNSNPKKTYLDLQILKTDLEDFLIQCDILKLIYNYNLELPKFLTRFYSSLNHENRFAKIIDYELLSDFLYTKFNMILNLDVCFVIKNKTYQNKSLYFYHNESMFLPCDSIVSYIKEMNNKISNGLYFKVSEKVHKHDDVVISNIIENDCKLYHELIKYATISYSSEEQDYSNEIIKEALYWARQQNTNRNYVKELEEANSLYYDIIKQIVYPPETLIGTFDSVMEDLDRNEVKTPDFF